MSTNIQQDNVKNISITRPGTDPSLSGIALTFPLDSSSSSSSSSSPHDSFTGALHTFLELLHTTTKCEVSLLGWSSPAQSTIGRDVWEEDVSAEDAYAAFPVLKESDDARHDVSEFDCAALLEIGEVKGAKLEVRGSPLLVEKARAYLPAGYDGTGRGEGLGPGRCPALRVWGDGAVGVGKRVVVDYSEYVAKLFENFD